jgi:N-acetylgalactosamine-N,N'-diacetylbacillosaminyl-diphospho-undecaprenol 4-alpha-N-acetylgalactosaminyltransferase
MIAFKVAKFAKDNNIDTIVSFLYRPDYINILTKYFGFKGRSIINIRSTTSRYLNEGLLGKVNLFLIRALFNKADLIISNSIGVKEDLNRLMDIQTKHIAIPNPIDIEKVKELENSCQGIAEKIDENTNYIITVGRLIPTKRHRDLLLAFSKIHTELENTKLLLLGDGELKEDLMQYANELDISSKVIFLGNVDNPFYYLKRSKLFVMTSELEGFPNVLIEAMACGLPVISSNCKSGPDEILAHGKYGILYDVGDVTYLAKKIMEVMENNVLRESLQKLAYQRAQNYNIEKIMKQFEEAILTS